jgi:WD40 repeat protein
MRAILRRFLRGLSPRHQWTLRRWYNRAYRFLLGNDVFVSYGRGDGTRYPEALVHRLAEAGLICYYDRLGAPPGTKVSERVLAQAGASSLLVIVAGPRAAASSNVAAEIERFNPDRKATIPIDFGGALEQALWRASVAGITQEQEPLSALEAGLVSDRVIHRITGVEDFVSRNQRLRQVFGWGAAAVVAMVLLGLTALWLVNARAAERLLAAGIAEDAAKARAFWSQRQASVALDQAAEARRNRDAARRETSRAQSERIKQQAIAAALQLANEAEALRTAEPWRLETSAHLAAEAVRRLLSLGANSDQAAHTLRMDLEWLRPRIARIPAESPRALALNRNGEWLAIASDGQTTIHSLDPAETSIVRLPLTSECCERMAFLPDDRLAVVDGNVLRLCSVEGNPPSCREIGERASEFAFSPDGRSFVSIDTNVEPFRATVWRLDRNPATSSSFLLPGGLTLVLAVALSEDGSRLGIGIYTDAEQREKIQLVNLETEPPSFDSPIEVIEARPGANLETLDALAIDRKGERVVAALNPPAYQGSGEAVVWDSRTKRQTARLQTGSGALALAFVSPGGPLAVTGAEGGIRIWDTSSRTTLALLVSDEFRHAAASRLAPSFDGRFLAAVDLLGPTYVWNLSFGFATSPWKIAGVADATFLSADGRYLVRQEGLERLAVRDLVTREISRVDTQFYLLPNRSALSSDDKHVLFSRSDGTMGIAPISRTERVLARFSLLTQEVSFSRNEHRFAVRKSYGQPVKVYEAGRTRTSIEIPGSDETDAVKLSPTGKYLAVAGAKPARVEIWGLAAPLAQAAPRKLLKLPLRVRFSKKIAWSPRGDCLALGSEGGETLLWRAADRRVVTRVPGAVEELIFSPDARFFAIAGEDGVLRVSDGPCTAPAWNAKLSHRPMSLKFHPGGRVVAVALYDGTIEVWDLGERRRIAHFGWGAPLRDLAFAADGKYLVSIDTNGTVRQDLWRPEDLLAEARFRLEPGTLLGEARKPRQPASNPLKGEQR